LELKIIDVKSEPLLSRKLVKAQVEFEKSTPNYAEVTSLLSANLKAEDKLIAIRHIYNSFGARKADIVAYIYSDEAKKQLVEPKLKEKKDKKAKEAKK